MRQQKHILLRLFSVALFFSVALPVYAAPNLDKYHEMDLADITRFLTSNGLLSLSTDQALTEYLKIADCDIYKSIKNDPFKMQEAKQSLIAKMTQKATTAIDPIYIRIPSSIMVTGYNFDTQSLNLAPQSQMKKVNMMQIINTADNLCEDTLASYFSTMPTAYNARLNIPISLYRLPLKKNIAESILPKLDKVQNQDNVSIVYTTTFIQIEPIKPDMESLGNSKLGILRGQVNYVDLYADADRKILLKRLNYLNNY